MQESEIFSRIPPHSIEAEQAILGAALIDNEVIPIILSRLQADSFYHSAHSLIFTAIADKKAQSPCDLITIAEALKITGKLESVGGHYYISTLVDNVASSANVEYYINIVQNHAIRREMIKASTEVIAEAMQALKDVDEVVDKAQASFFSLATLEKSRKDFSSAMQIVRETFKIIEDRHLQGGGITGLSSGFDVLDNMTAGFQKGDLVLIAGRPSMGKTALALNILEHMSIHSGKICGYFSLEMGETSLMMRLLSSLSGVDGNSLRRGIIREGDWAKLTAAAGQISDTKLFINDLFDVSPMDVKAKARRLKAEMGGLDCLVIDYIQLMRPSKKETSREREIASISRELKGIAKDLGIPVLALSQLNRAVEQQADKRPTMAGLRESGAQEQDADLIMMIYRDEVYNKSLDNPERGMAEVIITKQRNGPIGTVKLQFDAPRTKFHNLARQDDGTVPYYQNRDNY